MPDDKLPSPKEQTNTGELSQELCDFIVDLRAKIQQDDDDLAQWKLKMIVANNQRMGVKRYSEYPYPGAPDFPLPETDKMIKKQVPNLVLSAWAPKKMCLVNVKAGYAPNPQWEESAKKAEEALNMLLRGPELDWFKKLTLAADYRKEKGFCLFRVRHEFKSRICTKFIDTTTYEPDVIKMLKAATRQELRQVLAERYFMDIEDDDDVKAMDDAIDQLKSGEEVIEFRYEEVESFPNVDVPLPTKVIVPSYTTDIKQASRLTYEYFLTRPEIERLMDKKVFRKKDLESMAFTSQDDDIVESQKRRNEGTTENLSKGELYRVHECYCWMKEDGEWRRKIFVFLADCNSPDESLLADIDFPYEFAGWNWVKSDNEQKDPRYFASRGVPEQIRAYQEIMERGLNNMLIRDEMTNTPMWEVVGNSELMSSHIRFVPGQKLPVRALGTEISRLDIGNIPDMSSSMIMHLIKGHVEEYQSSNDYLFRNATNAGGGKTLGEVQQGMQMNAKPISMDVAEWNNSLSSVYNMMFEIMKERLGESIYLPDGTEVTKEDFQFPAEVKSNGDIEMADSQLQSQRAAARLQVLLNPALQDMVTPDDKYNIVRDWLEREGSKDPDEFITDPKEVMQDQSMQMKQQLQQMQGQLQAMAKSSEEQMKDIERQKKQQRDVKVKAEVDDEEMVDEFSLTAQQ